MLETIRIADSHGNLLGYMSFEANVDVQDAMKRLEKLETERKELKRLLSRCFCILYECGHNSDLLLIKEIGLMSTILESIDP